jgi:hypothetical protein
MTRLRYVETLFTIGLFLFGAGTLAAAPITDASYFNSVPHTLISFEQDGSGSAFSPFFAATLPSTEYSALGVSFLPNTYLTFESDPTCGRPAMVAAGGSLTHGLSASNTQSIVFTPPVNAFGVAFYAISLQFATFTAKDSGGQVIEAATFAPPFIDGVFCGFLEFGFIGISSSTPIASVEISAFSGIIDSLRFALADADQDGVPDGVDNCVTTPNSDQADTDGDGSGNACDGCPNDASKTSPGVCGCGVADTDSDGDGAPDCIDGCSGDPYKIAPGACGCGTPDTDGDNDGTPDCNDACPGDPNKTGPGVCGCGIADSDGDIDGVPDCIDNCPAIANSGQVDGDGDGIGDACDICPFDPFDDADLDGVCADVDNCPADGNSDQGDADNDGAGNVCDACPNDAANDSDGDEICGDVDNCPTAANADQADFDGDALGDACDPDDDNDGLADGDETTAGTNPYDADSDNDGVLDGTEVDMAMGGSCPSPIDSDSDNDGLSDGAETLTVGTSPCDSDSDDDQVPDNLDPLPIQPGVTSGFIEDEARETADNILALNLGAFNGPNNNANSGRRTALANKATAAANLIAAGDYDGAISALSSLLEKIDDQSPPPDWMSSSSEKTALADEVEFMIYLLTFF